MYRHGLALVVAPLTTPILFTAWLTFEARDEITSGGGLLGVGLFFGLAAYAVALVAGLPAIGIFRLLSVDGFVSHLAGGCAIGLIAGVAVDGLVYYGSADAGLVILCVASGGASAAVYWLLAFRILLRVEERERELYGE